MKHQKLSRRVTPLLLALVAGAVLGAPALAQETKVEAAPVAAPAAPAPAWSDAEFEKAASLLTGSWASGPLEGGPAAVVNVAPVAIPGMTDVLYFETARADAVWRPYRHGIWQFYRGANNQMRLRTMEFRRKGGLFGPAVGTWAAPAAFPVVTADDLITTMDIALKQQGGGYAGATEHPFPTGFGGATSMTSAISFDGAKFITEDRGFNALGERVWGPEAGMNYTFEKAKPLAFLKDLGQGLFVVEYETKVDGKVAAAGDLISVHYVGYLADGRVFDASFDRGTPLQYGFEARLIEGWNRAMTDLQPGVRRRLIIPGDLAYGPRGRQGVIPPNATLYFDIEVVAVAPAPKPEPAPEATTQPAQQAPGAATAPKSGPQEVTKPEAKP
jgi:hypothetical protein